MSQQDRGAYTPQTDAPLAFDARAPHGGRRPLPMALIGSAVVLLVLIAAVVMYYKSGARPAEGPAVAVGDPVGAVKTAPADDAQAGGDPFSNLDVYAAQNVPTGPTSPAFAPAPEEPKARPAPGLTVQTVEPSPVHPVPAAPDTSAPRAAPATAPTTAVATAPVRPAAPAPVAKPAPVPAPRTAVATAPTPTPAPTAPAAPAGGASASVQIGAYSSTALADKGFHEVSAAFPGQMAGKHTRVEPLARDGKTLYRGLIGGFSNRASAQAFCDALKAAGRVCLVRG